VVSWLNTIGTVALSCIPHSFLKARPASRRRCAERKSTKAAIKEARQLRRNGDFTRALAAYDRLPHDVRERVNITYERASIHQQLGHLNTAYNLLRKVLAADPSRQRVWEQASAILRDLNRENDLRVLIEDMLKVRPRTSEILLQAASMARSGRIHDVADDLLEQALAPAAGPSAATIFKAAQIFLSEGEQGRALRLLDSNLIRSDLGLQSDALDLRGLALAQLRLAGLSAARTLAKTSGPM
jgi:tetratricopeptide (TPR) repeat protein